MATEQKVTRKLRAILSADVKGYSRLMTDDESLTIQTLKAYQTLMAEKIKQHSGRVVDAPGDNLLAEFASAVNAVQCSVEIQKELKRRNVELSEDKRLEFRIGVNIGDVVQDGERLYGEGVNIAARIEGLADPGGVCISRNAYDHIKNKLKLGYEYFGEHSVKNIKDPVRVYKVLMAPENAGKLIGEEKKPLLKTLAWSTVIVAGIILIAYLFIQKPVTPDFEPASIEKMKLPLPDKPSIAVLAFDNMTGDKEQEYFSDGLSEEIITALASVPELFVIARNSSFTYKGKPVKVQQISEELGVRYVLEGSVRKSKENFRITVQLIDALEGHHLWAENYDRKIEDLFAVQEEITVKVITELLVNLSGREDVRFREPCSDNIKAYLTFLKGIYNMNQFTREGKDDARRLFEKAVELDPGYSCAYGWLGGTYRLEVYLGASDSPKKSFATAKKWSEKAIDADPSNPGSHASLANIYSEIGLYDQAVKQAEKALSIDSNHVLVNRAMGFSLYRSGRSKEALPFYEKALRLDPFSTITQRQLGQAYFLSGQNEKAIETCKKLIDRTPQYLPGHLILAAAYSTAGLTEEAEATASTILKMDPKFTLEQYSKKLRFKSQADKELIISNLLKAGLPENPPLPLPDKPSIAVLAFDNMSGDPEQEYFSDGISESIIATLSKISQLFVIARNSSFTYKGKAVKVQQIARDLGVRYVLEGSVQKTENRVRITAQLIDAVAGNHLWAERYDRELEDTFALQDEIVMKIVTALQVNLTEGEQSRVYAKGSQNFNVFLRVLESQSLMQEGSKESLNRFGQVAKEIVDMAPESDIGNRLLGWHHWTLAMHGESPQENIKKAYAFAQKAISIDETNGLSHELLCSVYMAMKKYEKAIASGRRAIKLQPNYAEVYFVLGQTLMYAGRIDEALVYIKKAFRLNPIPPHFYYSFLGRCYMFKEQLEDALSQFKKADQQAPNVVWNQLFLAINYIYLDRNEDAHAAAQKALELLPNLSVSFFSKISKYQKSHTQSMIDAMRKAGFPE